MQQFKFLTVILIHLPLLLHAWCSPSDSGECTLTIRGGRKSKDTDFRTISFVGQEHTGIGQIKVLPSTSSMSFWTGNQLQLSLNKDGKVDIVADLHVHETFESKNAAITNITTVNLTSSSSIRAHDLQSSSIIATTSVFGSTNVTTNLHVLGDVTVAGSSMFAQDLRVHGNVFAEELDTRTGAYLEARGSVEIFSDRNDAHIDFKSRIDEDSVVRIGVDADKLLLHGRHMVINNQGQVGIGTEPTHSLHVNGIVRASSSTITTGSDRRVKQDIQSIDTKLSLERIASLKVRNFAWHPAYKHTTRQIKQRKTGFIAQEINQVMPEAVQIGTSIETFVDQNGKILKVDGMHTVNMDPVIMNLVGAVQALNIQVAELREMLINCTGCTDDRINT